MGRYALNRIFTTSGSQDEGDFGLTLTHEHILTEKGTMSCENSQDKVKVLLDTDIGGDIDDALCLAYLLCEPRCDLIGITTVCGESWLRASIADAILRAAGRQVPVAAGMDKPLRPISVYPTPDGAEALSRWPHGCFEKADVTAFMHGLIRCYPHDVVLIGIGCMTNIAALFRAYPDAPGLLRGLHVMNGYFGEKPLPEPWYNWNAWADPIASAEVFAARIPSHRVIPLNVTNTLSIDAHMLLHEAICEYHLNVTNTLSIDAHRASVLLRADTPLMRAVFDFGSVWLKNSGKLTLHDPLAAVSVFHPDICLWRRGMVQVETEDEATMAATAFAPDAQGWIEVAYQADIERFYSIFSDTINR
jgi:purine nucleosidase